ncbi:MAG TPA: hypothetical protein PLB02_12210, partial [Thermoanaerobaculia bacterium]|nr:hypothetical protein [Thermoanaerobaculia bacterium]
DLFDKATPSASGSAALALARLARKTGDGALAREAREAVEEVSWLMVRSPHGTESWFLALEELLAFERERGEARPADDVLGAARAAAGHAILPAPPGNVVCEDGVCGPAPASPVRNRDEEG